jgi:presenilin-like A22 family membrane protease
MTLLLWKFPEWYIIDSAGILMCIGLSAILGLSFGIIPALILLVLLAAYDAIAVYQTKHMIALADTVMSESLPIMFVIPKHWDYSFLVKRKSLKEQIAAGERRDALFMGFGDVVIPGALVVSAYYTLPFVPSLGGLEGNLAVALITLAGGLVGFSLLMRFVLKGNPQAGLPLLNGGTVAAFIVGSLAVYGTVLV